MRKVGVILSGCGVFDGAEIHESVLTLLALDQYGAQAVCCAPDIAQAAVIDHATKQPQSEKRNVLQESARIARGEIHSTADMHATDLDALILPGGFGAAKNLCNFAEAGADCRVDPTVARLVGDMLKAGKPVGAMCIAPGLLGRVCGEHGIRATLTIGHDVETAAAIVKSGCIHQDCHVDDVVVDASHKIVTTPAYRLARGPAEVWQGVQKLVERVLALI